MTVSEWVTVRPSVRPRSVVCGRAGDARVGGWMGWSLVHQWNEHSFIRQADFSFGTCAEVASNTRRLQKKNTLERATRYLAVDAASSSVGIGLLFIFEHA